MSLFSRVLATAAATLSIGISTQALAAGQPNVLFIAIDDLKPLLGCYGDPSVKTPHMDRLAARGTVFLNAHCQQAVCGPSRASLMTGKLPDSTKVFDLKTKMRDKNPDILTIPQHFRQHGYETAGIGKVFDSRCVDSAMDKPSWSIPYIEAKPARQDVKGFLNAGTMAKLRRSTDADGNPLPQEKLPKRPPTEGSEDVPDNVYHDGAIAETAAEWIGKLSQSEKPYFFAVGFFKPHLPFNAPKKYWDLYDRSQFTLAEYTKAPAGTPEFALQPSWELRSNYAVPKSGLLPPDLQREMLHGYHACVSYADAQVGKLLDAVDASGEAEETIIVLWGDHGWHLGDHGMWCKHSNFEQATRSPLIIAAPGQRAKGQTSAAPTEFTDIFPTLCSLANLPIPGDLHGSSLAPVLDDPAKSVRAVAMSQFGRHLDGKRVHGYTYRSDRHRYTIWMEMDVYKGQREGPLVARELYDYQTDPGETRNLIGDPAYQDVLSQMEQHVAAHPRNAP